MEVVSLEVNVGPAVARVSFDEDSDENRETAERELAGYRYVKHFPLFTLSDTCPLISQGYWGLH